LKEPGKLASVTRISVTAKVPPTTISNEGALTKILKEPPSIMAVEIMKYASMNPTIVAMSTQMLLPADL